MIPNDRLKARKRTKNVTAQHRLELSFLGAWTDSIETVGVLRLRRAVSRIRSHWLPIKD